MLKSLTIHLSLSSFHFLPPYNLGVVGTCTGLPVWVIPEHLSILVVRRLWNKQIDWSGVIDWNKF